MSADRLLVRELSVQAGERTLLREISLELRGGELTLLVGSSGAGKSVLCRALVGLTLARPGLVAGTVSLLLDGQERPIFGSGRPRFEEARGPLSWLPQHGQGALDPLMTVRSQLQEAAGTADPATLDDALAAAGFDPREAPLDRYPHQLSGGMAQRVALARALLRRARILLVDEPTTGLDPGAAAVVLDTLGRLRDRGVGLLLISHDLRLAPRVADRILFLDRGRLVESVEGPDPRAARSPEARALVEATRRVAGGAF